MIGRDHLDAGSVASPQRETEAMRDGSDAVADWPILNALVNTATGASWVSFHHGGGVGMGLSLHAGQVSVADGTDLAAERIRRTLLADPGMGIVRHVDAGYDEAIERRRPARGADPHARMTSVCAARRRPGAAPARRTGCPYLRHDRAAELTLEPGDVVLEGGRIARLRRRRAPTWTVDASGCAVLPGFVDCHTHLPFAGWRAEEYERKVTGVPVRGDRPRGRRHRVLGALARGGERRGGARAGAGARRASCSQHGTTAFEGKTGLRPLARRARRARRGWAASWPRGWCSRCA